MNGERGIDLQPANTTAARPKVIYLFMVEG
jgi:hypothetical protein